MFKFMQYYVVKDGQYKIYYLGYCFLVLGFVQFFCQYLYEDEQEGLVDLYWYVEEFCNLDNVFYE